MNRRTIAGWATSGMFALLATQAESAQPSAAAQSWNPTKTVRLIVGYPPGGPVDQVARAITKELSAELGQQVLVENRAGAGGALSATTLARAEPDGHTIGLVLDAHVILPSLMREVSYDPVSDFTALGLVVRAPMIIAINSRRPFKSFSEVAAASKAGPKSVSYGVAQGTMGSLAMLQLQKTGQFDLVYAPYKGAAQALQDALGGQIDMVVGLPSFVMPSIKSGRMHPLAVTSGKRWDGLPDVQTLTEQGFGKVDWNGWMGMIGPAGLPPSVVQRYERALKNVLSMPEVRARIETGGLTVVDDKPGTFSRFLAAEATSWRDIIRTNNLKLD